MKQAIKFTVFLNSETRKSNKVIFERVIWSDDSVTLNYDELFMAFRLLFGNKCVILVESENVG